MPSAKYQPFSRELTSMGSASSSQLQCLVAGYCSIGFQPVPGTGQLDCSRPLTSHLTTSHLSPLTSHLSPLTSRPLTSHLSPLTSHRRRHADTPFRRHVSLPVLYVRRGTTRVALRICTISPR